VSSAHSGGRDKTTKCKHNTAAALLLPLLLPPLLLSPLQVLTEALNWLSGAVTAFLLPAFSVPSLLSWAKDGCGNANAGTRTASVALLGTLHAFLGPALGDMVRQDVKPALMATLEAEFERQPQRGDWAATRVARCEPLPCVCMCVCV
jgi:hypothetical protein